MCVLVEFEKIQFVYAMDFMTVSKIIAGISNTNKHE